MTPDRSAIRLAATAAMITLVGMLVSGPIAFAIVQATHPQPAWEGPARFVASYHPIQVIPFFGGFALVAGFVLLITSLHAIAPRPVRARTTGAVAFVAAFAAPVVFNYLVQTTFLPQLVRGYTPGSDPVIATFAMANPGSLAWCVELWAYALLGAATWLVAPVFVGSRIERMAAWAFVTNGPVSIATAVLAAFAPGWVMTTPGLIGFMVWNGLVGVMAIVSFVALRRRANSDAPYASKPARTVDRPTLLKPSTRRR